MSIPFPPPFSRCPFPSHQRVSLSLSLSLSPSFSLSPPLPRSILLATLLDISGAHACNEIRMPRALAEPGHTPIERMNCGPSRKPSENRPRCCPPSANLSNPPPPHGRFASRLEKVAVDILSLSKFLHCSVSHRYFFPGPPLSMAIRCWTSGELGIEPVGLE